MSKKTILIILDGWGSGKKDSSDAIHTAKTPFMDSLQNPKNAASSFLKTCGEDVGLPDGQMGNSEVGHLNIGAGRIVFQDLVKINHAIRDKSIEENKVLLKAFNYAKKNNKQVHFLGLVSDGGVHASTKHLMKLCDMADAAQIDRAYVHVLTDGRDTDPQSGLEYVSELQSHLKNSPIKIASICGRYYTMDRDKRWERVKLGYDLLVHGKGESFEDPLTAIKASYQKDVTDEFIKPTVITENGQPISTINEDDVIICFNFRTDRLREITTVLTQQDMPEMDMKTMPLHYVTMTRYDENFKNINIVYEKDDLKNTMGEIISLLGKKQLRIAETEKYPHVTFFFSGGREKIFEGEERIMVSSPKVATYDLQPEMSAPQVRDKVIDALKSEQFEFICLNFANGDMVGHTGVYEAIITAVETVDALVEEVATTARDHQYSVMITADHGNADNAVNLDGSPNTAHSLNVVPVHLLDDDHKTMKDGKLADLAPTLLRIMGIEIPKEMTGDILI